MNLAPVTLLICSLIHSHDPNDESWVLQQNREDGRAGELERLVPV